MNYTQDEFFALMEDVENQGGELTDDQCVAHRYTFVGDKTKPITISGCGNQSIFEVPYDRSGGDAPELGTVKVCAVDDELGLWPRFGGDKYAAILDALQEDGE